MKRVRFNNIIKCVGTLYELNLTIAPINDTIYIKGAVVVKSNNDYIRFYINTPKYKKLEYYRLLETFGVQYELIKRYDKDKYILHEEMVNCILGGKINDFNIDSSNPTKVYLTSTLTSYGYKLHHISRVNNDADFLSFNIDGSPYIDNKFIIPSAEDILEFDIDTKHQEDKYSRYKLNLEHNNGYSRSNNIINNIKRPVLKLNSIKKTGKFNKELIDDIVILKG